MSRAATSSTFHRYDFVSSRWEAMAPMAMADWGCVAAVLGGQLYSVGRPGDDDAPASKGSPAPGTTSPVPRCAVSFLEGTGVAVCRLPATGANRGHLE